MKKLWVFRKICGYNSSGIPSLMEMPLLLGKASPENGLAFPHSHRLYGFCLNL